MRIFKGCCAPVLGIAALLFLAFMGFYLNWSYGWWDQSTTQPVPSPDRAYTAYVGERGMLDSVRCRLYVKRGSERAKSVMDLYGADLKWSPDSKRVAVVNMTYPDVFVYDVTSRHVAKGYLRIDLADSSKSSQSLWPDGWEWRDTNTIVFYRSIGETHKGVAKVDISDSAGALTLRDSKGRVLVYN